MSIPLPRRAKVYQVDAFTRTRFSGNPAGVVLEADGLDEARMQRIARELNNSETAFVLRPEGPDHEVRLRFFTPTTEVPSCGHATIAAHFARAMEYGIQEASFTQLTGAGPMPIRIATEDGAVRITMTQGPVVLEPPLPEPLVARIRQALGLAAGDLAALLPVQVASTGHSKVMVPLKSRDVLAALAPDMPALARLSADLGCNGYFPFTFDRPDPGALVQARMFAPAIGIPEDPVTGNGHGPLGAYLVHHRAVPHDGRAWTFRGAQGDRTGRSGHVDVRVELDRDRPLRVSITGDAVVVFRTEMES
jgi:PhzF family phenazine biosynthesis protein